jgi:hypothetical protein
MTLADGSKMSVGDRFIWRDMFGIAGAAVAGKIVGILAYPDNSPAAVSLDLDPSATMAQIVEWIKESAPHADLPSFVTGLGGPRTVSGYRVYEACERGNLRLATGTEEERASLAKMPDWWATRREDLARQKAEEKREGEESENDSARRTLFRVLRNITAMFALAEPIPEERDTVRASGNVNCHVCGFELWRHATDPREPDMTITCSGRVHL